MDCVTELPNSSQIKLTAILIRVCHLSKIAHFVPYHKQIATEETVDLFIDNGYKLDGVPKVIVFDKDPRYVGKFWQLFKRKLNTKLNIMTARHPQADGLT
jgi:hypothetical protein